MKACEFMTTVGLCMVEATQDELPPKLVDDGSKVCSLLIDQVSTGYLSIWLRVFVLLTAVLISVCYLCGCEASHESTELLDARKVIFIRRDVLSCLVGS